MNIIGVFAFILILYIFSSDDGNTITTTTTTKVTFESEPVEVINSQVIESNISQPEDRLLAATVKALKNDGTHVKQNVITITETLINDETGVGQDDVIHKNNGDAEKSAKD